MRSPGRERRTYKRSVSARSSTKGGAKLLASGERKLGLPHRRGWRPKRAGTAPWGGSVAVPPQGASAPGAPAARARTSRRARGASAGGVLVEPRLDREPCAGGGAGPQGHQGGTGADRATGGGARLWVTRRAEAARWSRMRRMRRGSVMKATWASRPYAVVTTMGSRDSRHGRDELPPRGGPARRRLPRGPGRSRATRRHRASSRSRATTSSSCPPRGRLRPVPLPSGDRGRVAHVRLPAPPGSVVDSERDRAPRLGFLPARGRGRGPCDRREASGTRALRPAGGPGWRPRTLKSRRERARCRASMRIADDALVAEEGSPCSR